jgi:mono/diheme cytochrome c family protein
MKARSLALLVGSIAMLSGALAQDWKLPPETEKCKPAPGAELAAANCLLCHSADYVSTQPRLTRAAWKITVEKMRVRYGAPIATNRVDDLVQYLATAYGVPGAK